MATLVGPFRQLPERILSKSGASEDACLCRHGVLFVECERCTVECPLPLPPELVH